MSQGIDRSPHSGSAYDFLYPLEPSDKAKLAKLHFVRDAPATAQFLPALIAQGYRYRGPIFNRRPGPRPRRSELDEDERPPIVNVDFSFLRSEDIVFQACRPPIDDYRSGTRRRVPRSYTNLEELLIQAWAPYLEYCARDRVCVGRRFRPLLRGEHASRREMGFHVNGTGATYVDLNAFDGRGRRSPEVLDRTALFFLRLQEAWPGGPGYMCAFGQDGVDTYLWSYRLANDFAYLLERPCFAMAELEVQRLPAYPLTMDWCLRWNIELLFVHELGDARLRRMANA